MRRIGRNHPSHCKDRPGGDTYEDLIDFFWQESFFFSLEHTDLDSHKYFEMLLSCFGQVKKPDL